MVSSQPSIREQTEYTSHAIKSNNENDQNTSNLLRKPENGSKTNLFNLLEADNESILNISDSVLNKFKLF